MKRIWLALVFVFLSAAWIVAAETNTAFFPLHQTNAPNITDLALIYCGNSNRPAWTPAQLQCYVSYTSASNSATAPLAPQFSHLSSPEQWIFDGFLFIEFRGNGVEFEPGWKQASATKKDWVWLLDRFFEPSHAIPALEESVAQTERRIGKSLRPRQVVITMPSPPQTQTNWGDLNGKKLLFTNPDDLVAASNWYIAEALKHWNQLKPTHLRLAGFYWLAENAHPPREFVLPKIGDNIRARGLRFFWIPYWNAAGAGNWKALGFDIAYQQPNYFFHTNLPPSRIQDACDFARQHGMGMEMELDSRLLKSPDIFAPRMEDYLNAFDRNNATQTAAVACYEGGGALISLSNSSNPEQRQYYGRLARWILARQSIADEQVRSGR